ncbi:MAG: 1-acyl-sn-glycerol-3-phosphate acyltransferase, partial [Bdellovibrionaceae bacterium]|nr:1-acyl-sn-glycerol-3-phosphate acyltransferase [Pseudobdellovibrionaceae bacterium]
MIWMMYFLTMIAVMGVFTAYGLCTPFYLLSRVYPPAKSWGDIVLQKSTWGLLQLQPWLRMEIALPKNLSGQLLISNHRSHLAVFLFLAHVKGVRVLAKDSLFRIPFLGFIMRMSYQIPIVRGSVESYVQSLKTVQQYLENNEVVLIFPEMTRGTTGLKEFPLAPFKMAREAGAVIQPIAIQGSEKVWPKSSFSLKSGHTVTVRALAPVHARYFESSENLRDEVHERLLQELTLSDSSRRVPSELAELS